MPARNEPTFLVTGATGHLGINLISLLIRQGAKVRALVHERRPCLPEHDASSISFVSGNVLSPESLGALMRGVDGVFHLAARISIDGDPDGRVWKTNVEGSENVARAAAAAGVRRLVHCSSIHALRIKKDTTHIDESLDLLSEDDARPAYDRSKAAAERAMREVCEGRLELVSVLPSGVIGPHDPEPSRMGRVFRDLKEGRLPGLVGGGFDFVDVRDVAQGMLAAMQKDTPSARYVLGGEYVSIANLAALASEITTVPSPRLIAPLRLAQMSAPAARLWGKLRGQAPLYTPDSIHTLSIGRPTRTNKASKELGYTARPLRQSIRDVYASFDSPERYIP